MIYKFIDNNGSEITVNSLSSLQALVDSETVKKNTKVKAGLRGKWTTAEKISDLVFEEKIEEQIPEETIEPEKDIKSIITQSENSTPQDEIKEDSKTKAQDDDEFEYVEEIVDQKENVDEDDNKDIDDNSDYYTEKFNKQNEEEDGMGLDLPQAVKICFKKYFDFKGRASRSEYWYFLLFIFLGYGAGLLLMLITPVLAWLLGIFFIAVIIPAIAVAARRLHDINKSGWFQAIPIPPGIIETVFVMNRNTTGEMIFLIIGLACYIYLIVLYCTAGDSKKNRFGKNPLK